MGFKHPEFLYALFAILIPVIIHLFNYRRYKKLLFSNIQFLKNITVETRKQNQIKQLIVLLLRILAIVFLVLAFAGPEWKNEDTIEKKDSKLTTLYLDNSYSMMAEGSNGRLFDQALEQARDVIKIAPRDERFLLVTNENISGKSLLTNEAAMAEIDNLTISASTKKISSVLRQIERSANDKGFRSGTTYLFSDFQKGDFDAEEFPSDSMGNYIFIPLNHLQKRNIYIDSCWIEKPVILPGKTVQLKIRLKNASASDIEKIPLKVFINEQQKAVAGVDLKSKGEEIVTVNFTLKTLGWHRGLVQIEDYPINFDDKLYFTFNVSERINVLEISGNEADNGLRNFYTSDSIFNFQQVNFRKVDYNSLKTNHLIILNALPELSSGLISQMTEYTASGGNLIFIPNLKVPVSDANALLQAFGAGRFIATDTSVTRVSTVALEHVLFKEAITRIPENAALPVVQEHYRLSYGISSSNESLIGLLNGDDLFVKKDIGKGCFYVLTTSIDRAYSNLASNALFVPIMYNSAFEGNSSSQLFYTIAGSENISEELVGVEANPSPFVLQLYNSDYTFIPEQNLKNGRLDLNMHDGIFTDGFYELSVSGKVYRVFAYNYNRAESIMDFYDAEQIREALSSSGILHFEVIDNDENSFMEAINLLQKEGELWKLFIIFALLMLLSEVLILRFWKS